MNLIKIIIRKLPNIARIMLNIENETMRKMLKVDIFSLVKNKKIQR
jgi:hypothetical protein